MWPGVGWSIVQDPYIPDAHYLVGERLHIFDDVLIRLHHWLIGSLLDGLLGRAAQTLEHVVLGDFVEPRRIFGSVLYPLGSFAGEFGASCCCGVYKIVAFRVFVQFCAQAGIVEAKPVLMDRAVEILLCEVGFPKPGDI
ncbi:hypothetical protein G6F31_019989 [Rhizopus arrhizus]|nr:hypothetical protein G6F31_019989 [Rhizopus arrhizus]